MVKKIKIRYTRVFIVLFVVLFALLVFVNLRITNIYISGNYYFSEQEIIEMAKIDDYPKSFFNSCYDIKKRIFSSGFFNDVRVNKKKFTKVYIDVDENRPLFYSELKGQTVLKNGDYSSKKFNIPVLTNDVPSDIYDEFIGKFSLINYDVLDIISEISYAPNDVDKELFLFSMNDGNYIYINIDKFSSVNKYFDIVIKFNNHKGILYLDSGEYFKILDN